MNFCTSCGTKLKPEWNICPNCMENLKVTVNAPQTNKQINQIINRNRKYNYGTVSLIFSILALLVLLFSVFLLLPLNFLGYSSFLYYWSFIFSPIAIYLGKIGMRYDLNPTIAKTGYILGLIVLSCCIIYFFIALGWGGCC